ncbi:hypothetical protein F5Y09DRAFT_353111 [Xylaria sp. FL1042]|nr:hypothetical protein F5Y09DRAFT_353111 [Xylaria sp. FL1042]
MPEPDRTISGIYTDELYSPNFTITSASPPPQSSYIRRIPCLIVGCRHAFPGTDDHIRHDVNSEHSQYVEGHDICSVIQHLLKKAHNPVMSSPTYGSHQYTQSTIDPLLLDEGPPPHNLTLPWTAPDDDFGSNTNSSSTGPSRRLEALFLPTSHNYEERNAAERATKHQSAEQSRVEHSKTADDHDYETNGESIESRVARIKIRVAELTSDIEEPSSHKAPRPGELLRGGSKQRKQWNTEGPEEPGTYVVSNDSNAVSHEQPFEQNEAMVGDHEAKNKTVEQIEEDLELLCLPKTPPPISLEQLVAKVKGIYAKLMIVVQKHCVVDKYKIESLKSLIEISDSIRAKPTSGEQNEHLLWKQRSSSAQVPRAQLSRSIRTSLLAQEWHIEGKVNGRAIDALADTGANINAISKDDADRIGIVPEPGTAGKTIQLPSGKTCLSLGAANFGFNFDGDRTVHSIQCNIVENLEYSRILCYDFLRKTETLTRFFKDRIKEVVRSGLRGFSLCLLDDPTVCDGVQARMDGFINGTRARVVPDTGSGIMAVSASYARRLGLKVDTNRRTRVTFADGSSAITSGIVKAAWTFLPPDPKSELRPCLDDEDDSQNEDAWNYEWEYEWHVIEGLPVDAILSLDFIKQHDIFNQHEHVFVLIPPRSTLAELFGICELPGGNEELRSLAEEFLADLASPDPFTYNMIVRESARRNEIQRKVRGLQHDAQATQLAIEQKRIDSWTRIHNAKVNGKDWSRLRDEYLVQLRSQPDELILPQHSTVPTMTGLDSRTTRLRGFLRWRSQNP